MSTQNTVKLFIAGLILVRCAQLVGIDDQQKILAAAQANNFNEVAALLEKEPGLVAAADAATGDALAHYAAGNNNLRLLALIRSYNGQIFRRNNAGYSYMDIFINNNLIPSGNRMIKRSSGDELHDQWRAISMNGPFYAAAYSGNTAQMEKIYQGELTNKLGLLKGTDSPYQDRSGYRRTPLMYAIEGNSLEAVKWIYDKVRDNLSLAQDIFNCSRRDNTQRNIFYKAAEAADPRIIILLWDIIKTLNPNPNIKLCLNQPGLPGLRAPLEIAVRLGHFKQAQFLIDQGADMQLIDKPHARTLLDRMRSEGNEKAVEFLLKNGAEKTKNPEMAAPTVPADVQKTFIGAVERGDISQVTEMLNNNKDLLSNRYYGDTPLQIALISAYTVEKNATMLKKMLDMATLLIMRGIGVNALGSNNQTALHVSAGDAFVPGVALLLDHEANPNIQDKNGLTALDYALNAFLGTVPGNLKTYINQIEAVVRLLLEHGAHVGQKEIKLAKNNVATKEVITMLEAAAKNTPQTSPAPTQPTQENLKQEFFDALDRKDVSAVEKLLKQNPNLANVSNSKGQTPLQSIALLTYYNKQDSNAKRAIIKLLIKAGADRTVKSPTNNTLFDIAMDGTIRYLLNGSTPLEWAIEEEDPVYLGNALLSAGPIHDINTADDNGKTPLIYAIKNDDASLIRQLIEKGADARYVNKKDDNKTLLHYVAQLFDNNPREQSETIKILLEAGADRKALDEQKNSPLYVLSSQPKGSSYRYLLNGSNKLQWAIVEKNIPEFEKFIKTATPADINHINDDSDSPLTLALAYGTPSMVEQLITKGADVERASSLVQQHVPLFIAINNGDNQYVDLLLKHGASIKHVDDNGNTPLHIALRKASEALKNYNNKKESDELLVIAQLLLDKGADINAQNSWKETALYEAAYAGFLPGVKFLLEHGANPNITGRDNFTPLHEVINSREISSNPAIKEIVELLLAYGANVNLRSAKIPGINNSNLTVLEAAKASKGLSRVPQEIITLLEDAAVGKRPALKPQVDHAGLLLKLNQDLSALISMVVL